MVPISLKKARYEPLDEDLKRRALLRFRDIVLGDPLSTQLGTSLKNRFDSGTEHHDDIDQSFRDCFTVGQYLSAFYLGWLAAPLTHLLLCFVVCFSRGTPILAGGIGVARAVVGAVFGVGSRF